MSIDRKEIIDILNGMCERCLIKGLIQSLDDARKLYDVFDRFRNNGYVRDDEYSDDILYFYNLATELHKSGNTSLEESYSIYNAILTADRIDFVETSEIVELPEYNNEENIVSVKPVIISSEEKNFVIDNIEPVVKAEPVKIKRTKTSKNKKLKNEDASVVDISDISL